MSILRRPLLHQPPLAPPTPLQEQGESLTRSRFSCPPVTWLKGHYPFHAGGCPQAPNSYYMQMQRRPQSWKRPPGRETILGPGEAESHNTDGPPSLGTDPRPEELPLPHARSASAVPPVQPVLWVLVVPPHWGRGAQPASRLIPGSAGSRRPTPQRTDAGAAQPPRVPSPRSASPRSKTAP